MCEDLVRVANNARKGDSLEYEIRRYENKNEQNINAKGLLNWIPVYITIPEDHLMKRGKQIHEIPIPLE